MKHYIINDKLEVLNTSQDTWKWKKTLDEATVFSKPIAENLVKDLNCGACKNITMVSYDDSFDITVDNEDTLENWKTFKITWYDYENESYYDSITQHANNNIN
jgi:hypothetical protein